MLLDFFKQIALDVQVLDDGFDDQIAFFQPGQIVFEVTDSDEGRTLGGKECGGVSEPSFGAMSSSSAGTPALARCAAICAPIVPAPRTAAFLTCIMAANNTE